MENIKKPVFSFKEYYNSHPEFREKHLAKMAAKYTCACGRVVGHCNKAKHERTPMHQKLLANPQVKPETFADLKNEIIKLRELITKK